MRATAYSREAGLNEGKTRRYWLQLCDRVADRLKIHTRPFVAAMAGREIGTGTFVGTDDVGVVSCAHMPRVEPYAHYVDDAGSTEIPHLRGASSPAAHRGANDIQGSGCSRTESRRRSSNWRQ
jgi:hypothetical protein